MNIKVNYDLINEIRDSKRGFTLADGFATAVIGDVVALPAMTLMLSRVPEINLSYAIGINALALLTANTLFASNLKKKHNEEVKSKSKQNLYELTDQLNDNNIDITPDLLKEAVVTSKKYRFEYKDADSKAKRLKKYKYIDVPLSNGYNKTLVQEHFIGSKDYSIKDKAIKK